MLRFFKINDPYRLVAVFLLLVIFRLPYWLTDHGVLLPELQWMIVGERMAEGHMMYYEVWDYISPLSAGVYWIIDLIFGRSVAIYNILALLIAFAQTVIFNVIAYKNKFYPEANYIPALIYAILISVFMDFFTLSPMLMGVTFVLLALNNVVSQIEFRAKRDEKLVSIGIYIGIAALFHFPLIIFGPIMIIVLIFFSSTIPRRFILIFYGWLLPSAITGLYYFLSGKLHYLWINHWVPWFYVPSSDILSGQSIVYVIFPVLLFILLSFYRISRRARITNYQSRLIQVMLFSVLLSMLLLFIEIDRFLFVFIVFVPGCAYFISFYFILSKRKLGSELIFLVFIIVVIGLNWMTILKNDNFLDPSSYFLEQKAQNSDVKVVMLSDDPSTYINTKAANPYVNWKLAERAWNNMNRYRYLSLTVRSFISEKPDIIYDPHDYFKQLLQKSPVLKTYYKADGSGNFVPR